MGCHFSLQGNLPDPGVKLMSPVALALQAGSLPLSLVRLYFFYKGLPGGSVVKNPASVGDASSVPESGRSPGEGY